MSEFVLIQGELVPVPWELREAQDYRAAVAKWHEQELERRGIPHVVLQPVLHGHRCCNGLPTAEHGPAAVVDLGAVVEVPPDVRDPEQWVVDQRAAAAKREFEQLRARERGVML